MSAAPLRVFLAHSIRESDAQIDAWCAHLRARFAERGVVAIVIAGRDDFRARSRSAGGWDAWMRSVAQGTQLDGSARFQVLVVPTGTEYIPGRATQRMIGLAREAGREVLQLDAQGVLSRMATP